MLQPFFVSERTYLNEHKLLTSLEDQKDERREEIMVVEHKVSNQAAPIRCTDVNVWNIWLGNAGAQGLFVMVVRKLVMFVETVF